MIIPLEYRHHPHQQSPQKGTNPQINANFLPHQKRPVLCAQSATLQPHSHMIRRIHPHPPGCATPQSPQTVLAADRMEPRVKRITRHGRHIVSQCHSILHAAQLASLRHFVRFISLGVQKLTNRAKCRRCRCIPILKYYTVFHIDQTDSIIPDRLSFHGYGESYVSILYMVC